MRRLVVALASLVFLTGGTDTDWKWFGASTINGDAQNTLYDAHGVKRLPGGHIQVWMKTISASDLNNAKLSDAVRDQAVGRALHGYKPEAFRIAHLKKEQILDILLIEAFANEGVLPSKMQMLWELDCKADMSRTLSVRLHNGEQVQTSETPGEWSHNAPETNASRLHSALCP